MRARVLPALIAAIALLLAVFVLESYRTYTAHLRRAREETSHRSVELVGAELKNYTALMEAALEAIASDDALAAPLEAGDRDELLRQCGPLFSRLRERFDVEHFYFHRPDRTNLVRLHEPDHHGDTIDRITLRESELTGAITSGIEQGPTGNCTLRVVRPWRLDGRLLGYIELGTEFGTVARRVHDVMQVDLVFVADKARLNREHWEKRNKKAGLQTAWDEFPGLVVIDSTLAALPAELARQLANGSGVAGARVIKDDGKTVQLVSQPLNDPSGRTLGSITVLRDISAITSEARRAVLIACAASIVIGGTLVVFFYIFLGRVGRDLRDRSVALASANATLEKRIAERTAELEAAHARVVELARRAGMAEVASGVLHNVGNVLNSVNVAAGIATETLRKSELGNLLRAGEMIREHRGDLTVFLESDERGRHLPDFLLAVSQCLAEEQQQVLQELRAVAQGVGHIKHVVGMQQTHARRPLLLKETAPADLVETALQLQQDALTRHDIAVERRLEASGPVLMDKHRVLQILVNLISNAKHAVMDAGVPEKRLTLSAGVESTAEGRRVRFEVADNGVGIAAENLDRIFGFGFTTRKTGHGFGLHSAANAAQELGGSLTAASDGPGLGARYLLLLPVPDRTPAEAAGASAAREGVPTCTAS